MNCEHFSALTGMRCEPVGTRTGDGAVALLTPFTFFDGDGIELFASSSGAQAHFFDDGSTMHWLHGLGLRLGDDRRRWAPVRNAAAAYGVTLADDGCLEAFAPLGSASVGFARMVSATLAIDAWARDHAGLPQDATWLAEEAAMYLRAWQPQKQLTEQPSPVAGLSGRAHSFHLRLGEELVDAISPSPGATGAELRKLVDVRALPSNSELQILVIVDDRRDQAAARQEGAIIGNFAKAWPMSRLIAVASSGNLQPH